MTARRRPCEYFPEVFYPHVGQKALAQAARRLCFSCSTREPCLEDALKRHETFGIWGGTNGAERKIIWQARTPPRDGERTA